MQSPAWFDSLYLKRLVGSSRGRAFLLSSLAEAEEADEGGVFDNLLARVDDPALGKLVRRHRDDEARHAKMYRACVARTGVTPLPVPSELRIVERIDRLLGGFSAGFAAGKYGVMEAYLLLQVIEERGVQQFARVAQALDGVDPESATVVRTIVVDEERHVLYARAISRRYAPDAATLERELRRFRAAEEQAFIESGRAFLQFVDAHDLLAVRGPERLLWRGLAMLSRQPAPLAHRESPHAGQTSPA
jgi:demethoxyubiquinone hydroxylase (CLK1/Coq7/Cat5 family)